MGRVFVIGCGPLPLDGERRIGFPQIRTAQVLRALLGAGHSVRAALLGERERALHEVHFAGGALELVEIVPERGAWLERVSAARRDFAPGAVVTAGPYEPARAAALTVGEEPLWVDVPGDPFAEAQARTAHPGEADATPWMRAAWGPALARGDAFGAIGAEQRYALLGQLGWLGRLVDAPPSHDWVAEVPIATGFPGLPVGEARELAPGDALVVALVGGFNTWLDGPTLLAGLLAAMDECPGLGLICTGGEIPGHHTRGYADFRAAALAGPHAARFAFRGWLPQEELPGALAGAHVGLSLDRPGVEPELGTRTRLLLYNQLGLAMASSTRCGLARELAERGHLHPLPAGDAPGVARALVALSRQGLRGDSVRAARRYLDDRYSEDQVYAPLLRWLNAPTRSRPGSDPAAALGVELARARQELAKIHQTPTWRASARIAGLLRRKKEES